MCVASCCVVMCGVVWCYVARCAVVLRCYVGAICGRVGLSRGVAFFLVCVFVGVWCGSCGVVWVVCVFVCGLRFCGVAFSCRVGRVVWLNLVLASYLLSVFA